jgi:hypothetical protein
VDGNWHASVQERIDFAKVIDEFTDGLKRGGKIIEPKERETIADDLLRFR